MVSCPLERETPIRRRAASTAPFVSALNLPLEPQARPTQINLIPSPQLLPAPIALRHFDRSPLAKNPRAELAFVVHNAILARFPADVGVLARDGRVDLVALFERHVVAAHHALLGIGQLRQPAEVGPRPVERVLLLRRVSLHDDQTPGCFRSLRARLLALHAVLDLERTLARLRRLHFQREAARQLALRAFQRFAHVLLQPAVLAERRLVERAPAGVRRGQRHRDVRIRKDALAAGHRLNLAADLFQDGAMHQQQLAGIGRTEHPLREAAEAALDALFDFGKQVHGWISPNFAAAFTISAAAGAAAVPPYTPFSTNTASAILRGAAP